MTCATLDTSGNTVMDLTGRRIEKVDRELQPSWFKRCCWFVNKLVFEALAVRSLEAMAVKYTDDAIWFKGASAELWDDNQDVRDHMGVMIPRLDGLKVSLLKIQKDMLSLQSKASQFKSLQQAAVHVSSSAFDLFNAIEAFKWTLLELEANCSPIHEGYTAQSPEELARLIERIQHNA